MLRRFLYAVPTAALVLTGAAAAQAQQTQPAPGQPAPGMTAQAPLMTAPRPDDQPTTDSVTSPTGVGGEAPSREVQNPAAPVGNSGVGSPPVASLPPAGLDPQQAQALVGKELRTRDGQPGGRILDFTMAPPVASPITVMAQPGIDRVVLAPNEVMGVGTKLVSVPASALIQGPGGPMLDLDAAELESAPAFAYDGQPTLTRPNP